MEIQTHLPSLVRVLGQVAIIVYAYSWVIRTIERGVLKSIAIGLLFGLGGILSMGDPIRWMPGVFQDGRSSHAICKRVICALDRLDRKSTPAAGKRRYMFKIVKAGGAQLATAEGCWLTRLENQDR